MTEEWAGIIMKMLQGIVIGMALVFIPVTSMQLSRIELLLTRLINDQE